MKPSILAAALILCLSACQSTRQPEVYGAQQQKDQQQKDQQQSNARIYASAAWNWGKWGPWAPYPGFAPTSPASGQ
jgi:hypothetical protein